MVAHSSREMGLGGSGGRARVYGEEENGPLGS